MPVIVVANPKGGVGKSTLAALHADAADVRERRRTISAAKVTVGQACRFVGQQAVHELDREPAPSAALVVTRLLARHEGHQEHRPEHGEERQGDGGVGHREPRVLEEPHVQHRGRVADLPRDERRDQDAGEGDEAGQRWSTVDVSSNVIDASFQAILDGINWKLMKAGA